MGEDSEERDGREVGRDMNVSWWQLERLINSFDVNEARLESFEKRFGALKLKKDSIVQVYYIENDLLGELYEPVRVEDGKAQEIWRRLFSLLYVRDAKLEDDKRYQSDAGRKLEAYLREGIDEK